MAAALLAAGTFTEAAMIKGDEQVAVTLFSNIDDVDAKKGNAAADQALKWTLQS